MIRGGSAARSRRRRDDTWRVRGAVAAAPRLPRGGSAAGLRRRRDDTRRVRGGVAETPRPPRFPRRLIEVRSRPAPAGVAYGLSKASLHVLTMNLQKQYPDLLVNTCSPGYARDPGWRRLAATPRMFAPLDRCARRRGREPDLFRPCSAVGGASRLGRAPLDRRRARVSAGSQVLTDLTAGMGASKTPEQSNCHVAPLHLLFGDDVAQAW